MTTTATHHALLTAPDHVEFISDDVTRGVSNPLTTWVTLTLDHNHLYHDKNQEVTEVVLKIVRKSDWGWLSVTTLTWFAGSYGAQTAAWAAKDWAATNHPGVDVRSYNDDLLEGSCGC